MKLGYRRSDYFDAKVKVPITITLSKQTPHILICGKSGSGKSIATRYYIYNMLVSNESRVFISDYKSGEEYELLEGSPAYASGETAIQMIMDFYDFFTEIRNNHIKLKHHYSLVIEEYFGLLVYASNISKTLKSELMSKIGEMLAVSRGLNLGIILTIQRADSSNFSAGAREQFQCVISFGRCSAEQFKMLGYSNELDANPTNTYKAGQALALIDNQDSIHEIIVPWITNPDKMCISIRKYLDSQPDIQTLIQTAATGRQEVQQDESSECIGG